MQISLNKKKITIWTELISMENFMSFLRETKQYVKTVGQATSWTIRKSLNDKECILKLFVTEEKGLYWGLVVPTPSLSPITALP